EGEGMQGEMADAVWPADDLARQQREPGHPHADRETGADAGQRPWQNDVAEDAHARSAERLRRANEHFGRLLHAVKSVQNDREQRAEEGDVNDRAFLSWPEQDG